MPSFLYQLVLELVGKDTSGSAMLDKAAVKSAEVGVASDVASTKVDKLSSSHDRLGTATSKSVKGTEDSTRAVKDAGTAADDVGRKFDNFMSRLSPLGHLLTLLGVSAGDGEKGLKGAALATDGAVTGFTTFTPAVSAAQKAVTYLTLGSQLLIPALVGLGLVFSPLIASVLAFTVALSGALSVLTLGVGVMAAGAVGMTLLAVKTQGWAGATANVTNAQKALQTATSANTTAQQSLASAHASVSGATTVTASQTTSLANAQQRATTASQNLKDAQEALTLAQQSANNPLQTLQQNAQKMGQVLGKAAVPTAALVLAWLNQFIPTVQKMGLTVEEWFASRMPHALAIFANMANTLLSAMSRLGRAIGAVVDTFLSQGPQFENLWKSVLSVVVGAISGLLTNLVKLSDWFFKTLPTFEPLMKAVFGTFGTILMGTIHFVGNFGLAFAKVFDAIKGQQGGFNALQGALQGIGLTATQAATATRTLHDAIDTVEAIVRGALQVLEPFAKAFAKAFASAYDTGQFSKMLDGIQQSLGPFVKALKDIAPDIGKIAGTILSANLLGLLEQIVPGIVKFATAIAKDLKPPLDWLAQHSDVVYKGLIALGVAFAGLKVAQGLVGGFKAVSAAITGIQVAARAARLMLVGLSGAQALINVSMEEGAAKTAALRAATLGYAIAGGIAKAATTAWDLIQKILNIDMLLNPVTLIVVGVLLLIGVIILLVTHWKEVHKVITEVWNVMKSVAQSIAKDVGGAFSALGTKVHQVVQDILDWIKTHWMVLAIAAGPILGPIILVVGLIITHWNQIKQAFQNGVNAIWQVLRPWAQLFEQIFALAFAIVRVSWQLFVLGITTIVNLLVQTISKLIADFLMWFQVNVQTKLNYIWGLIQTFFTLERQGFQDIFNFIRNLVQDALGFVQQLWQQHLQWIWNWLVQQFNNWKQGFMDVFDAVKKLIGEALLWWQTTFGEKLDYIWSLLTTAFGRWKDGFSTVFNDIRSLVSTWVDDVQKFFTNLLSGIADTVGKIASNIGSSIYNGLMTAIQDVDNFIASINSLLSKVGIDGLPYIGNIKKGTDHTVESFATGGALPMRGVGAGFITNGPTFIAPRALVGEGMGGPEYVIPTATQHRSNAMSLWASAGSDLGVPGFASGGILDWVGKIGGQCLQWITNLTGAFRGVPAADDLVGYINSKSASVGEIFVSTMGQYGHTGIVIGPNEVIDSNWVPNTVTTHALNIIPNIVGYISGVSIPGLNGIGTAAAGPGGLIGNVLSSLLSGPEDALKQLVGKIPGLPGQIMKGVLDKILSGINSLSGNSSSTSAGTDGSPTNTPGNVVQWLTQALQDTGEPMSWLNDLEIIAKYESSDNPNANQGLSGPGNALGLMQTVAGTFQEFMLPGHGNIFNPIDNAIASIRYIASVYGNPGNTPGVKSVLAGGPYHGYASGGVALTPQIAAIAEHGPERVSPFNPQTEQQYEQQELGLLQQIADSLDAIANRRPTVNSYNARLRHA